MNKNSKNAKIIWRPLGQRKRFLKRPESFRLSSQIKFYKNKLNKNFRFQHYLRKHFLKDMLNIDYLPPHQKFDFSLYLKRLDMVLYLHNFVRTPSQARHFIRKGFVNVDGCIVKKPEHIIKSGSLIELWNTYEKGVHASLIHNETGNSIIYTYDDRSEQEIKLLPAYLGEKKEDLSWILNQLRKR